MDTQGFGFGWSRMRNVFVAAALILVFPVGASAQSKLDKFFSKVDAVLGTPNASGTSRSGRVAQPNVRYASPGIPEQVLVEDKSAPIEIHFEQERTSEHVKMFNEALPLIDKVIGVLRYASSKSDGVTTDFLDRFEVDDIHMMYWDIPSYYTKYHDQNLCLEVSRVMVNAPANNALALEFYFLATDSGEISKRAYLFRRDYRGVWQIAHYGRL